MDATHMDVGLFGQTDIHKKAEETFCSGWPSSCLLSASLTLCFNCLSVKYMTSTNNTFVHCHTEMKYCMHIASNREYSLRWTHCVRISVGLKHFCVHKLRWAFRHKPMTSQLLITKYRANNCNLLLNPQNISSNFSNTDYIELIILLLWSNSLGANWNVSIKLWNRDIPIMLVSLHSLPLTPFTHQYHTLGNELCYIITLSRFSWLIS